MPSLEARLARNEVMFRAINERIRELAGRFAQQPEESLAFVCECSDESCVERVQLTLQQDDDLRGTPARLVIVSGHEAIPLVERVAADTVRDLS